MTIAIAQLRIAFTREKPEGVSPHRWRAILLYFATHGLSS